MASGSSGEWVVHIKPLLSASYSTFSKHEIADFTTAIIKCGDEILDHDEKYEPFYSSFVALSSHYLSGNAGSLPKSCFSQAIGACKVLLKFMLRRLSEPNEGCTISPKYLMTLVKGLCVGTSCLPKSDIITFTAMLKSAMAPPNVKENDMESEEMEQKDLKRSRLDTGSNIFDQLTSVFQEVTYPSSPRKPTQIDCSTRGDSKTHDRNEDAKELFAKRNLSSLTELEGSTILLDVCQNLIFISRYTHRYKETIAGTSFVLPNTLSEALTARNSYLSLLNEISIVWRVFSLPILEPLTPKRLDKIVSIVMSCLYTSMSVAMANSIINMASTMPVKPSSSAKEEEIDSYGSSIVQKSLEIFDIVSSTIRNSTRAGGNMAQNLNVMAAWLLLRELQAVLSLTPSVILERRDSGKSKPQETMPKKDAVPSTRPGSGKSSFQGFEVLSVALASNTLQLIQKLLDDVGIEGMVGDMASGSHSKVGIDLNILSPLTAWKRIRKLLSGFNLIDLLLNLVVTSFKKAAILQRVKQGSENSETSSSSTSDSNTFYEDDFSSSEDSSDDEDEDSEPILGHWLEETLSPSEPCEPVPPPSIPPRVEGSSEGKRTRKLSNDDSPNFIPDRREPQSFISLAANILNFLNIYFVTSTDPELQKMVRLSLNDHMCQLASLVRDLDKECTKPTSDKVFEELSIALAKFNHSLLSTNCLSEALQDVLLSHLGVSPNSVDAWPLTVQSRTLAVLAEVLLLKQQKEREAKCMKCQSEAAIVNIWVRFMATLKSTIINFDNKTELFEDINVEHLQLLLFLFHSLPLMQKKSLLLQLAQNIISISEADFSKVEETVPLPLSRMVLILDYLLHNFYDAPATLIEQVQWNLFTIHTSGQPAEGEVTLPKTSQFFPCSEVEESFWKSMTQAGLNDCAFASMKPRFYNLASGEVNNQDTPKVDGLACSFLLSNADCLNYNFLYDACISLLMAGSRCHQTKDKLSLLDLSAMHYHFLIVWRLLSCLPPSVNYLRLLDSRTLQMGNGHILHTLRLAPRIGNKVFSGWIKDSLVKQGLTTQQAEALLSGANNTANNVKYDVNLAMHFIQDQIAVLPPVSQGDVLSLSELPSLANILMLDAVIAKVQVALDDTFTKAMADIDPHKAMDIAQGLIPSTLHLLEAYSVYVRSCVLGHIQMPDDVPLSRDKLWAFATVMSISSSRASRVSVLGMGILGYLPAPVRSSIEKWNNDSSNEFPSVGAWRNAFASDIIPCEGYIDSIHSAHIGTLSSQAAYTVSVSLRHSLNALVRFAGDLVTWCPDTNSSKEMVQVMFPLMFDITAEYLGDMLSMSLERFTGPSDGEEFTERMYQHVLSVCHRLIVEYSDVESGLDEKIFHDCLKFMENHLEKAVGKKAFEKFYTQIADLTTLLLSVTRVNLSPVFATKVLNFFNKLLQLGAKATADKSYEVLCATLSKLSELDPIVIQAWLSKLIDPEQGQEVLRENHCLLLTFTMNIVKEKSLVDENVAQVMLSALLPKAEGLLLAQDKGIAGFPELMLVMNSLAGAGEGRCHFTLFQAVTGWLEICKNYIVEQDVLQKIADNEQPGKNILETLCCLLSYIGEILGALKRNSDNVGATAVAVTVDTELPAIQDGDSDWAEEIAQEEEDSAGEDSDEESLNNKLCTFTITQKEFMNQHWYHCHTCKMVDGVGVCTVCAKVCHKDHDLTYAKFGSFFCDCGAKEDGSCKALIKRTSQGGMDNCDNMLSQSPFSTDNVLPSSLRRRMSSPGQMEKVQDNKMAEQVCKAREQLCKQMETFREKLMAQVESCKTVTTVVELLDRLLPTITENYQNMSPMGSTQRAQKALCQLHTQPKTTDTSDQLMTVTLGSQEGAFENVRINYSGDQGQQIRQLISAHMLRRVAMCVLASPYGKRQHLAVSHEKGKITILQLTALLKQADSSKKKLTLTRLSSAPVPFTVLSITGNACNEDFLAVCGLKDCHVLTFNSSGSVSDHLVLHPSLATGNFIIKAVWLPGSQTEIAIITADFVKIYNLAVDALSPQFYFLLPSGKIRDVTFVFSEEGRFIVLMASTGYIYTQVMDDTSSAKHGPFYITNVLEVSHTDLKDVNGQVAGGGVSIYYSHGLQLLFFSYTQGRSFVAPVSKDVNTTPTVFQITFKSNNGSNKVGNSSQPLVQWSEVEGHTGLMYCMTQSSNNPIMLMIRPDSLQVQEIKATSAKAKIQDVVAIRHTASNSDQKRTTMILLCEDGSLRIYMANQDNTNVWLSPYLQPQSPIAVLKPVRQKKVTKTGRTVSSVNFPVDFFEHCQQSSDTEFGGNDVLQVYNVQQVKHRLNTTGMYIASTKPSGFTIEINNTNNTTVMVGVRVLVGSQSLERAPAYLEVFGRVTQVNLTRARWFDLPFTREESLTACKKFSLFIGASAEAAGVTMVDSIKVYVKTKETFGWPEEPDDFPDSTVSKTSTSSTVPGTDSDAAPSTPLPLTSADRLLGSALEVLDGAFATVAPDEKDPSRKKTLDIATQLLTLPTPRNVQQNTRTLLLSLLPNPVAYHTHKDQAQLDHVMVSLAKEKQEMDVEDFQRLLVTARAVAISRPSNLVKFAEKGVSPFDQDILEVTDLEDEKDEQSLNVGAAVYNLTIQESSHFISQLMEAFWRLHAAKPANPMLAPVCLPGLSFVDATVGALVEIIHAFTVTEPENVMLASKLYVRLLLCTDPVVSFACKQALIRCLRPKHRRRRVFIPSPPRCSSPGGVGVDDDDDEDDDDDDDDNQKGGDKSDDIVTPQPRIEPQDDQEQMMEQGGEDQYEVVDNEPMILVGSDQDNQPGGPISLESLLGVGNFPPIVDIPPDADDETMVELAIALSLQDQSGQGAPLSLQSLGLARQDLLPVQSGQGAPLSLQSLGLARQDQSASFEEGQMSDTTASAPGSDDEVGSNAATDGSTLRTSPAEPAGSAGSESGGSAIESLGDQNVSGRSSAYGDRDRENANTGARSETSSLGMPSVLMQQEGDVEEDTNDRDANYRSHGLRLMLLEKMLHYLPEIRNVGGVRSIPFMQVLLMLTSDLDGEEEKDRAALDSLLMTLLKELDLSGKDLDSISGRTLEFEVKLVIMRLLSVLLSRTKAGTKPSTESSSFISNSTASSLITSGAVTYCLTALENLLPYWKQFSVHSDEGSVLPGQLLKPHSTAPPPDMSPFFLRQYVKGHATDIFEDYPQLLTEMVLRLPYQLKKISDSVPNVSNTVFEQTWHSVLAEYMMTQQTPFVKRQVRKLLLFICGSKDKYRQLRDIHAIESHLQAVLQLCKDGGLGGADIAPHSIILPYDTLLSLIEHLKVCSDIGTSRAVNWQLYCKNNEDVMPFLVKASISLDEGMASTLLQLLLCALCGSKALQTPAAGSAPTSGSPAKLKKEKEKDRDKDKNDDSDDGQKHDEGLCMTLVQMLVKVLDKNLLKIFVQTFLLESNNTNIRWQAHSLVCQLYKNSSLKQQEELLDLMWDLWHYLPLHGRKAAQFVDLLGYFVLKTPQSSEKKTKEYLEKAITVLRDENQILSNHPNAHIYNMLQGLVDFDGYYLENDPCLVCNNPEVPFNNLKLSAIKVDSKFTTSTQIVKLVGSHTISKISLRITDLKRAKMVRVLNIYYNNRTVQAVVELKNKPGLWHKARKVTLTTGQTDVKVEFPVPIVACNLMIEYADFYDNLQASAETLQCPRCSASVPANPGVCNNCGENVFQCHKCRAINYDEKDPFLCNACGFCKYAKFDFTLTARPCCAVDPIENEDDRKKAIATINSLLEKADKIYKQLQLHRPTLETLLIHVTEHSSDKPVDEAGNTTGSGGGAPGSSVNKAIQQLAQKYCLECKTAFDELSKIIQKVMACRRELVEYDRQQREVVAANSRTPITNPRDSASSSLHATKVTTCPKVRRDKDISKPSTCYGCASSAVELCITLLRALVTSPNLRQILCSQGMIKELIDYNLRRGPIGARMEVRALLCALTKDNRRGTEEMNNLIMTRISAALRGHLSNPDLGSSVRHEIMLLASSLQQEDTCWEQRTKCIMRLFLMGMQMRHPVITESVTLPCLRILQQLMRCDKKTKDKVTEGDNCVRLMPAELHVNPKQWLAGDPKYSYQNWKKRLSKKDDGSQQSKKIEEKKEIHAHYLMEKYASRWQQKMWKTPAVPLKLAQSTWLQQAMFSPSSRSARQTACNIMESLAQVPARKKEIIDMLTSCLDNIGRSGECATEFLSLFKRLISPVHWKHYLSIKGILMHLGDLITKEVDHLEYLEETTLTSDLSQGYALKALTELLSLFVEYDNIKHYYKSKLVGYVLNGYLSLRKLVVQRTKLIDETQDKLLELLEELTTGTESETKEFMQVCVQTMKKYPLEDYRSPVFIFERICSIIFPEENDIGEFFMILEKDPQQEDFLQGRMLGNPYSSSEHGLGPLMRDVKNKICQDCELVALLEDDTGMELLVNKKIISLDLPVKDVYKKVWAPDHGEGEPMPIIYRMRGLLGDATEDMVNSLDSNTEEDVDKEEVFKMASVLGECGGLQVMLERLSSIKDLVLGKQLMTVLLKLFDYAVNIKSNRLLLIKPELNTITIMLGALNLALWAEQESGTSTTKGQTITEQILQIMEVILLEASSQPPQQYSEFSQLCGDKDQLMMLLGRINSPFVRANINVLQGLMRLIPFLAFGEEDKMLALINHFKPYLDFDKFDEEHTRDEKVHLDCFCVIASGIENNENGDRLKAMIMEHGLIQMAVDHILKHSPEIKTLLPTDSDNWKDFLSLPSLNYVLRLLTGMCTGHRQIQLLIGVDTIRILHKLEQVSSDKHIGTMAENLLEALRQNTDVAAKIEDIRQQTKAEKKRLAMAVRKKHLGALGMTTNEKGQVTVKSSVLKQMEDLKEETGLTCCICREGYRYQPQKVLAVYTFTKRVNLDDYENKLRKSVGYSTVSHFNVIHVDCHTAAVRHARGREEWESAALQNANTKCNGLLPMWGPQVPESAFATCLARHNTYLQECTGIRDPSYPYTVHDIKLLLIRFAQEKSLSDESGGGGRESNIHLLPYMSHMILYVINTTRSAGREEKNLTNFLDMAKDKWVENCFETENVLYWSVMAIHLLPPEKWQKERVRILDRLVALDHIRHVQAIGSKSLVDKIVKEYSTYKFAVIYFGLVCGIYERIFKKVKMTSDTSWSCALAEYIRHNDKTMLDGCDHILRVFEEEMLPCESFSEVFDVLGLLEDITEPDAHMSDLLASIP